MACGTMALIGARPRRQYLYDEFSRLAEEASTICGKVRYVRVI